MIHAKDLWSAMMRPLAEAACGPETRGATGVVRTGEAALLHGNPGRLSLLGCWLDESRTGPFRKELRPSTRINEPKLAFGSLAGVGCRRLDPSSDPSIRDLVLVTRLRGVVLKVTAASPI